MTSRGTRYWSSGTIPLIGPDVLGDIIASSSDLSVVISDMGEILSVLANPDFADEDRFADWQGRDIRSLLSSESVEKIDRRLSRIHAGLPYGGDIELNHIEQTGLTHPIRYTFHRIGPDGALLMLGRDLKPIAQMQQQLVEAQMALERDYEHQREIATRMKVLMETTQDAVLYVNMSNGRIAELNARAARLLEQTVDELRGQTIGRVLSGPNGTPDLSAIAAEAQTDGATPVRMSLVKGRKPIEMRVNPFRASGERMMLCRLERPAAEGSAPASELGTRLLHLFEKGADGLVFTDRSGHLIAANDTFLAMVDHDTAAAIKGRSLSDFLVRGGVDMKVLLDNAIRNGQMKLYATRIVTGFGVETPVEISATYLADPTHPALGFVMRDVSRVDGMRGGGPADEVRPTSELVGAATLKEIVAESTEVIEKMCIETAVELTGNNRVAAAEMLGLSRQSLYVKLRKYDLLARDD